MAKNPDYERDFWYNETISIESLAKIKIHFELDKTYKEIHAEIKAHTAR